MPGLRPLVLVVAAALGVVPSVLYQIAVGEGHLVGDASGELDKLTYFFPISLVYIAEPYPPNRAWDIAFAILTTVLNAVLYAFIAAVAHAFIAAGVRLVRSRTA